MLQVATNKFSHNLGINSRQVQSESRKKETFISLIICCALIDERRPAVGEKPGLAQGQVPPKEAGTWAGCVGSRGLMADLLLGQGMGPCCSQLALFMTQEQL